MKKAFIISIIFLTVCSLSCGHPQKSLALQGSIIVDVNEANVFNKYDIHISGLPPERLVILDNQNVRYSGLSWLNATDSFISSESIEGNTHLEYKSNIVLLNRSGQLVDRIYIAEKGEIAWASYPSRDDKYVIFTTHKLQDAENLPFEGLSPMVNLLVMDIKKKTIVAKTDSIGRDPNLQIKESPWLINGHQFVYSFSTQIQFKLAKDSTTVNPSYNRKGVYLYDIFTNKRELIVPDASAAIASPLNSEIAYEVDECVNILDLTTNQERTIFKYDKDIDIINKHYTPDGKFIYISFATKRNIVKLFRTRGEKLVEISSGIAYDIEGFTMGANSFSWK